MNIKLVIAYDGTAYRGWQKTKMGPSIEESLQTIIEKILQEKITLQAASRTDAGVHAHAQVVNFLTTKTTLQLEIFCRSLNCLLPKDIVILHCSKAPDSFHPTLECISKEYHYQICYGSIQHPHHRFYSWHYPYELNIELMTQAANILIGEHDFRAFCNQKNNESYENHRRHIHHIHIQKIEDKQLKMIVIGNHFLYKMVRNIVGTLVYVGREKLQISDVIELLKTKDRKQAGVTAPAHGLTLYQINYK